MGDTKTPHFYDLGFFEPVTKPQNQQILSLETPGHSKKVKKHPQRCWKYYFINLKTLKLQQVNIFRKDGHRKNEDPLKKTSKILNMGPVSS